MGEPINIRLYYGGVFVTKAKSKRTTYERGEDTYFGLSLHPNVYEVCYFEFADWIKNELKYSSIGQLWFRKRGCTLYSGRKEIKDDNDIPEFLDSPEADGWYNLYVTHNNPLRNFVENGETVGDGSCMDMENELESEVHENLMCNDSASMEGGPHHVLENPRFEHQNLTKKTKNNTPTPSVLPLSTGSTLTITKQSQKNCPSSSTKRVRSKTSCRSKKWKDMSMKTKLIENDFLDDESDEDDNDVVLSDGDYEDDSDDDLFAQNVIEGLNEVVNTSLGGPLVISRSSGDVGQLAIEDAGNINVGSDEDLNDSDDEVRSCHGSDDEPGTHYPIFNPSIDFKDKINLVLGQKFPSVYVFRKAIRFHAIENGYNYYYLHNGSKRVTVYCVKRCGCKFKKGRLGECNNGVKTKCRFRIYGAKVKGEETFQLKSLNLVHICGRQHQNNKVTSKYSAERFLDEWRDTPSWKLSEFMTRVMRVIGVEVGYYKCYYARHIAMQMIHGDCIEQYKRVWDYAEAIRMSNPGSTAIVKVTEIESPQPVFQRIYICLQPCKEGFMAGCRPIIGVDGCHLRGPYPGICLTAVGKDGNNNIFPVAWAIVEVENAETWAWFLDLLVKDLESVKDSLTWVDERENEDDVTYMSDRQKGLVDAFSKVVPNAEIRFCCRHIWSNFKKKFPGELFKEAFWKATRATTKWNFDCQMQGIKLLSDDAFNYLNDIPPSTWSRHAFSPRSKSGMLLNNCCESFNSVIRDARSKPLLTMLEWIRRYVMKRCAVKRDGLKKFEGEIMPSVMKMIERAGEEVKNCVVTQANIHEFEVDHLSTGESYVVNLAEKKCGCYRWELLGIPCYHALACISRQRLKVTDYIHQAYHVATYARTYAPAFHPMPGKQQWPSVNLPQPIPPPFRKMPGRPKKKNRIKEKGEDQERELVIRTKKKNKCGNCGMEGHYRNKCKNPPKPPTILPKGGRPRNNQIATPLATTSATFPSNMTSATQTSGTAHVDSHTVQASTTAQPTTVPAKRNNAPATTSTANSSKASGGVPKPKKHKSMVEVLSSQTSTGAKP